MEKAIKTVLQAKEEGEAVQYYIRDLNTWENEMKQKEAALKDEAEEQDIPPIRSKQRRDKSLKNKKKYKKQNFNPPAAGEDPQQGCEAKDTPDVVPLSLTLNHKHSEIFKMMQYKEEAHQFKERGNKFVKIERWDDAIACYTRAINLVKTEAIYYANRGLCYLKKESLHQAESDCTEALRLDPTYVKALQRRATAREKLGSLKAATSDLMEVLKLEPHNTAAKQQLESIKQRMGTKGRKAKCSPVVSPAQPVNPIINATNQYKPPNVPKTQEKLAGQVDALNNSNPKAFVEAPRSLQPQHAVDRVLQPIEPVPPPLDVVNRANVAQWKSGIGEDVSVIQPVKKPPHLRSKRPLKPIRIDEIPLSGNASKVLLTPRDIMRMYEDHVTSMEEQALEVNNKIDSNKDLTNSTGNKENDVLNNEAIIDGGINNDKRKIDIPNKDVNIKNDALNKIFNKDNGVLSKNLNKRNNSGEKIDSKKQNVDNVKKGDMVCPVNSVQFMTEWRNLRGDDNARCDYLNLLDPNRIPKVFANALESDVLSEIIQVLTNHTNLKSPVCAYLKGLAQVKRLSALAMFLSANDKQLLNNLLEHCKAVENCSDSDIAELKEKFEL